MHDLHVIGVCAYDYKKQNKKSQVELPGVTDRTEWEEELEDITCFRRSTKSLNEREAKYTEAAATTDEPRIEKTLLELTDPPILVVSPI